MNWLRRVFSIALFITVVPNGLAGQDNPPPPCAAPEFRQFDFWVGEWDLTWADGGQGRNTITVALDSCVIEENFTTLGDGRPFRGRSFSTYNPASDKWYQTWVDNNGGYLDFEGGWADGKMILSREKSDTTGTFVQRMVYFNIEPNSLDWNWERSDDGGETWQTLWAIHYERRL